MSQFSKTLDSSNSDESINWPIYWKDRDLPWRTEPEIALNRQNILKNLLLTASNDDQGRHPFKQITLKRDEVEWLIARYIYGYGLEEWDDQELPGDNGLNLYGAVLLNVNLHGLPLKKADFSKARLKGVDLSEADLEGANMSEANLEGTNFNMACLRAANLNGAHLNGAQFVGTDLGMASLNGALMKGVKLDRACLKKAVLHNTYLEGATLEQANLNGADLHGAHLESINARDANMQEAYLHEAYLIGAYLNEVCLFEADLHGANLEGATLIKANLEKACLVGTNLNRTILREAHFEGADLNGANLKRCDLRGAFFTNSTNLSGIVLGTNQSDSALLAGVRWSDTDLSVVDWTKLRILGDEYQVRQHETNQGKKNADTQLNEYRMAVRANRQLAVALHGQGLYEEAINFNYRAQLLQRVVLKLQGQFGHYLFSLFVCGLSGYGYRLKQSFIAYLLVILVFASAYYLFGKIVGISLSPLEAIVFSMTSFHGRGFSPGENISLSNPLTVLAAFEAFVGLIIEVTFLATLTQRFFQK